MKNIAIKIDVPIERVGDLLCSAWGSSAYWCLIAKYTDPSVVTFSTRKNGRPYNHEIALNEGGSVEMYDREEDKPIPARLDLASIKRGLEVFAEKYPRHFGDFISENDDGDTADVFLQCCLFGEARYG